jgi:hypothetical protein
MPERKEDEEFKYDLNMKVTVTTRKDLKRKWLTENLVKAR